MLVRSLFIVLLLVPGVAAQDPAETKPPEKANQRPAEVVVKAEPFDKASVLQMEKCVALTTARGSIEIEMFPGAAPNTVRNFLNLVEIGAFKNTTFSRVVPGFVIQGGNLYSNPDITYEMKIRAQRNIQDEPNPVRHERGIISMARGDEPNSANTDFFILVNPAPSLDNSFAAFGRVVKGMDVVDEINGMPVDEETPKVPVVITSTEIKPCVFEPIPAPKRNELPSYGLRGKVKTVSTSAFDPKGKKTNLGSTGWGYTYVSYELEFDLENGSLTEKRFFDENGTLLRTETYASTIKGPGKSPEKTEFLKDPAGNMIRELRFAAESSGVVAFEAFDAKNNRVGKGEIKTDENGRVVSEVWERFEVGGAAIGKYSEKVTYDAYGFEATIIRSDENAAKDSFMRFEYTDYDEKANWKERRVFDSESSKTPLRIEKRVIDYYE